MSESITQLLVEWQTCGEQECFSRLVEAVQPLIEHTATKHLRRSRLCTPLLLDEIRSRVWDHLRRLHPYSADERAAAAFRPESAGRDTAGIRYLRWLTQRRTLDVLREERRRLRKCPTMTEARADHEACDTLVHGLDNARSSVAESADLSHAIESLTRSQRHVVRMLLDGKAQAVIATSLGVSGATISRLRGGAVAHLKALLSQKPDKCVAAIPASTDLQPSSADIPVIDTLPCATIQYQVRATSNVVLERRYRCYAFGCLLDGAVSLTWVRQGRQQTIQEGAGTCNFFAPDDTVSEFVCQPTCETTFHTVLVPPEYFAEVVTSEGFVPPGTMRPLFGFHDVVVESLVRSLRRHRERGGDLSRECEGRLLVLRILELQGYGLAEWRHDESVFTAGEMSRLVEYVDANLGGRIMLQQLAQVAGLTPSHFDRKFHRSFGLTPSRLIAVHRVQQVIDRLISTEEPIHAIARSVGFCSNSHCTNTFRAMMGMSPSRFRKEAMFPETLSRRQPDEVMESADPDPA